MLNFLRIKSIRHLVDEEKTASLCLSLCISHLDYCNSLLYGLPDTSTNKLQQIQNMCACLALRGSKFDSTTQALKQLHWLPIKQRITFKILTLTYKCVHGIGPQYLQRLISKTQPTRNNLRSSKDLDLLVIPRTKCKTFVDRSFSVAGPTLWNKMPKGIRSTHPPVADPGFGQGGPSSGPPNLADIAESGERSKHI